MVLAVGVVLTIVSIGPVLAVVVLIQQVLWQVVVRPGQLQGVVVLFGDDFQHLGIVDRLVWSWSPGKWPVLHH